MKPVALCLPVPEIIVIKVLVGLQTPILRNRRPYRGEGEVGDDTVRRSVGEFL